MAVATLVSEMAPIEAAVISAADDLFDAREGRGLAEARDYDDAVEAIA